MTERPIPESYWVEENRLLAGEYPASRDPETARRRIEAFLETGIRTFIDLTQPHELVPYEPILHAQSRIYGLDLAYHRFSIRDHGVPSSPLMSEILDAVDASVENGKPVYLHCWGGVGRTGVAVACYFIRHGFSAEGALLRVANLYKTRPQTCFFASSPETPEQFEFVRSWREEKPRSRKPRYGEE